MYFFSLYMLLAKYIFIYLFIKFSLLINVNYGLLFIINFIIFYINNEIYINTLMLVLLNATLIYNL